MRSSRLIPPGIALALCLAAGTTGTRAADGPYQVPVDSDGIQRVAIVGGSYFFKPDHLVVKAGTPVELVLRAERGIVPHRFVLKLPPDQIAIDAQLGEEPRVFRFTPGTAGRYPYYCPNKLLFFDSHRDKGMAGMLEVVE